MSRGVNAIAVAAWSSSRRADEAGSAHWNDSNAGSTGAGETAMRAVTSCPIFAAAGSNEIENFGATTLTSTCSVSPIVPPSEALASCAQSLSPFSGRRSNRTVVAPSVLVGGLKVTFGSDCQITLRVFGSTLVWMEIFRSVPKTTGGSRPASEAVTFSTV